MKKFLKSAGLPIAVFALAIGSAFATNAMKNTLSVVQGYQQIDGIGLECEPRVICDTNPSDLICTWKIGSVNHALFGLHMDPVLGQTACTLPLYKIQKP
ncbi:DUF6520 family protein [Myroides odoratimimus]|uniref:DUF6520 family protein n=1 Tax=Myroides odoratimimus TaxID=76832 RepID=UPI002DBC49BD|nr:DUF6520 family protein [Myroides odoratimimus]MEC4028745.1 DUF6520 family protein [Myroides odoratimimus]